MICGWFKEKKFIRSYFVVFCLFLFACSGFEQSEQEKIRRRNCKAELIYRARQERFYSIPPVQHTPRGEYPWESEVNFPRITKEFFRCKGAAQSVPRVVEDGMKLEDCEGGDRHGLPLIHGKEGVYSILVDLLNYIQKQTRKRVVITCGHRCPAHNTYSDPSKENRFSKHQIGAEVDFYVQGMEDRPQEIVALIMQYYRETPRYQGKKDYVQFQRYTGEKTGTSIQPWLNKEVYLKIYPAKEGRDLDNQHPHPYLCIQVRYDRSLDERVLYTWDRAYKGYPRG